MLNKLHGLTIFPNDLSDSLILVSVPIARNFATLFQNSELTTLIFSTGRLVINCHCCSLKVLLH